jgi:predicted peroxiredoxin
MVDAVWKWRATETQVRRTGFHASNDRSAPIGNNMKRHLMRNLKILSFGLLLLTLFAAANAGAAEDKSMGLFVNLTTSQTATAGHAMHFASNMLERGHPVTFFLNNDAVVYATKNAPDETWGDSGKTVREMLADTMAGGAKVIVCRICIKMQGIGQQDFIEGAMLGNPELVSEYLFDPSYQVISW